MFLFDWVPCIANTQNSIAQVLEQMEQEEYLEKCFEQMWQEEEDDGEWFIPPQGNEMFIFGQATSQNIDSQKPSKIVYFICEQVLRIKSIPPTVWKS